jgi:hypothetical protein
VEVLSRLDRLLIRIKRLLDILAREHKTGLLNKGVNRYYYIQKKEELILLKEAVLDASKSNPHSADRSTVLMEKLDREYNEVYCAWKKDARWINKVLLEKDRNRNTQSIQLLDVCDKT